MKRRRSGGVAVLLVFAIVAGTAGVALLATGLDRDIRRAAPREYAVGPARAQDYSRQVELKIDRVYAKTLRSVSRVWPAIVVTITNRGDRTLAYIGISCTWLNEGQAIAQQGNYFHNLPPGGVDTKDFWTHANQLQFDSARCRVTRAR